MIYTTNQQPQSLNPHHENMASTVQKQNEAVFHIHPSDIGYLLGTKARTMKNIAHRTGATIRYAPYNSRMPDMPPRFVLSGTHQQVDEAFKTLSIMAHENLRRQWVKSEKESQTTHTMKIDTKDMGMVIGTKGNTIKAINQKYSVRTKTIPGAIEITGFVTDVYAVCTHINNIVEISMERRGVPVRKHPHEESEAMFEKLKAQEEQGREMDRPRAAWLPPPTPMAARCEELGLAAAAASLVVKNSISVEEEEEEEEEEMVVSEPKSMNETMAHTPSQ